MKTGPRGMPPKDLVTPPQPVGVYFRMFGCGGGPESPGAGGRGAVEGRCVDSGLILTEWAALNQVGHIDADPRPLLRASTPTPENTTPGHARRWNGRGGLPGGRRRLLLLS